MKLKYKVLLATVFVALLLSSCSQPPAPTSSTASSTESAETSSSQNEAPSSKAEEVSGILEQMDKFYAELDTSPIPQMESGLWGGAIQLADGTKEKLPPQLVRDEPKSYELAQLIRSVLYPNDNFTGDFDLIEAAYQPALLQTALYHTSPLDLNWSWNSETHQLTTSGYQDHVVTALLKNELEEGRSPSNIFSGDTVRETLRRLYGDIEIYEMDTSPYYYYAREDVFIQMGDWGGPMWRYPQITSYTETDGGVVCDAVLIYAMDRDTPLEVDGVALTAQNFEAATAKYPKYQYTFRRAPDDDRLILSGYKVLRAGVA